MHTLTLAFCVVILQGVSAWPWSSRTEVTESPTIQAQEHTITDCATNGRRYGETGNCKFYRCLEDRFSCGSDGYIVNIGQHFCDKIDRAYSTFDDNGKIWLNQTSVCLMSYMLPIYDSETTTCDAIKTAGINGVLECNENEIESEQGTISFCSFIRANARQYGALMGAPERTKLASLGNRRILLTMLSQGAECGAQMLEEAAQTLIDGITQAGRRVAQAGRDFLASAVNYITSS